MYSNTAPAFYAQKAHLIKTFLSHVASAKQVLEAVKKHERTAACPDEDGGFYYEVYCRLDDAERDFTGELDAVEAML